VKLAFALAICSVAAFAGVLTQQPAPQSTFRAGIDLVQVDVSVLDKHRKPVSGLTAADFTLLEDGKPRPVVAFTWVDLPEQPRPSASWVRDVAPDVATNTLPEEGRLVVILMDRSIPVGQPLLSAKRIARAAVDELGPGDLAAVIYTGAGTPQNLTSDRSRLLRAIDGANPSMDLGEAAAEIEAAQIAATLEETGVQLPLNSNSGQCYCNLCVMEAVTRVADAVRDIARRRKSLLFVGSDLTVQTSDIECGQRVNDARVAMFRATDLANLTVHAFDPSGLQTLAPAASSSVRSRGALSALTSNVQNTLVRQGNIGVLPDHTGGRTVMNTNEPGADMRDVFNESHSYYLLGFQPADPAADGKYHQVDVQVNRRGVDVRTRQGFLAPLASMSAPVSTSAGRSTLSAAVSGSVPEREIPLRASLAVFAQPGVHTSDVAIVLGAQEPQATAGYRSSNASLSATQSRDIEVLVTVLSPTARPVGSLRQSARVTARPDARGELTYELLSKLNLAPGRYEIRLALADTTAGRRGSVYTFVDVPNFSKAALSLSDAVVEVLPGLPAAPSDMFAAMLPIQPTARREFARSDRVKVFMRAYQAENAAPAPVSVSARVRDASNRVVFQQALVMASSEFGAAHAADYRLDLPVAELGAGDYLATIEASKGKITAHRDVRFTIR
jgi:VWFA-related protein